MKISITDQILTIKQHAAIVGITGSGKSYLANQLFKHTGGIFFNSQHDAQIGGFKADFYSSAEAMIYAIKNKLRINYLPNRNRAFNLKEIEVLYELLKRLGGGYIYIDEAHLYVPEKSSDNVIDYMIRMGRKENVHLVLISQSPSDIKKSCLRQVHKHIIFDLGAYERLYFRVYGLPFDEIISKTRQKYHFVVYENGQLSDAYTI